MHHTQLQSIPLFERLTAEERIAVARRAQPVKHEPGTVLVKGGEFSYELFAIVSGKARVTRDGEELAELGAGDIFGEMGVLPHGGLKWGRRNATVMVTESMTAVAIAGHDFRVLLDEIPALGEAVLATAAAREPQRRVRSS